MGMFAAVFHTQPSELWEFTKDDIDFWSERAKEYAKSMKEATNA